MCWRFTPGYHLGIYVRLTAMYLADFLPFGGVDPQVVVVGSRTIAQSCLCNHDPRVGMAENTPVLLIPGGIGGNLSQVEIIFFITRLVQHNAMRRSQSLCHRI